MGRYVTWFFFDTLWDYLGKKKSTRNQFCSKMRQRRVKKWILIIFNSDSGRIYWYIDEKSVSSSLPSWPSCCGRLRSKKKKKNTYCDFQPQVAFFGKKWSILLIILQDKESQLFLIGPSNGCQFDCRYPTEDIV